MRQLIFLAITVAVLAGLWVLFKPQPPAPTTTTTSTTTTDKPAKAVAEKAEPKRFALNIQGKNITGPATMKVTQGDSVQITVMSDQADELHLHGYDLHAQLKPGATSTLSLVADRTGRFELELHKSHRGIGTLEVYPANAAQ